MSLILNMKPGEFYEIVGCDNVYAIPSSAEHMFKEYNPTMNHAMLDIPFCVIKKESHIMFLKYIEEDYGDEIRNWNSISFEGVYEGIKHRFICNEKNLKKLSI